MKISTRIYWLALARECILRSSPDIHAPVVDDILNEDFNARIPQKAQEWAFEAFNCGPIDDPRNPFQPLESVQ